MHCLSLLSLILLSQLGGQPDAQCNEATPQTVVESRRREGRAMVYNPLDRPVKRTLRLSLYYTGLSDTATIRREEGQPVGYKLHRQYNVELPLETAPNSVTWFVIE